MGGRPFPGSEPPFRGYGRRARSSFGIKSGRPAVDRCCRLWPTGAAKASARPPTQGCAPGVLDRAVGRRIPARSEDHLHHFFRSIPECGRRNATPAQRNGSDQGEKFGAPEYMFGCTLMEQAHRFDRPSPPAPAPPIPVAVFPGWKRTPGDMHPRRSGTTPLPLSPHRICAPLRHLRFHSFLSVTQPFLPLRNLQEPLAV